MDMNEMLFKSNLHGYLETEFEEKLYNFFIGKGFSKIRLMRNFKDYFERCKPFFVLRIKEN